MNLTGAAYNPPIVVTACEPFLPLEVLEINGSTNKLHTYIRWQIKTVPNFATEL